MKTSLNSSAASRVVEGGQHSNIATVATGLVVATVIGSVLAGLGVAAFLLLSGREETPAESAGAMGQT
jgi:hypothetical protein